MGRLYARRVSRIVQNSPFKLTYPSRIMYVTRAAPTGRFSPSKISTRPQQSRAPTFTRCDRAVILPCANFLRLEILLQHLHLHRGRGARTAQVAGQGHAHRHVGQRRRHPAVQHAGAVH